MIETGSGLGSGRSAEEVAELETGVAGADLAVGDTFGCRVPAAGGQRLGGFRPDALHVVVCHRVQNGVEQIQSGAEIGIQFRTTRRTEELFRITRDIRCSGLAGQIRRIIRCERKESVAIAGRFGWLVAGDDW